MDGNVSENAEKVRSGLLLYSFFFFWYVGLFQKGVPCVWGWWGCCHGVCAYLFSIPQINPLSPRATGDAICTGSREGPHLGKHQAWAQLG